ncbi:MAG: FAD-dependent oxidoreductase, partial [Planktothrix sp.]
MTLIETSLISDLPDSFDVLVVGTGAAGLYTALCLPKQLSIGLVSKDVLPLSASDWAQGGIAAAISSDDSPRLHLEDTLKAGAGLCERSAVEFLVNHAPECIHRLVELGVAFDRHQHQLALT